MAIQRLLRLFSILGLCVIGTHPGYGTAATFKATGIVNFFCEDAGKTLAVLAWRDKTNGVPMSIHRPAAGFLQHMDNEIIQTIYSQPLSEDNAKTVGFRICVAMMVSR